MICLIMKKSKEISQQTIISIIVSKYIPSLNKSNTYCKKKKQLPTLKKKKMIQTRIVHNSYVLSISLRPINTDVISLLPQEIQSWVPWILKKELKQLRIKRTQST